MIKKKFILPSVLLIIIGLRLVNAEHDWFLTIENRDLSDIQKLIAQGTDVNQRTHKGKTALMIVARVADTDLISLLITAGAEVNAVNPRGGSALMYATVSGHIEAVRLLLKHDAKINAAGTNGWTALMIAAAKGHAEIVQLLLDHGAHVNARDIYGWTPLMRAAFQKHPGAVNKLLEHKNVNVNAQDDNGATALHHVASKGFVEIAKTLIEHGADKQSKDQQGHTPLMVASAHHHKQLVALLSSIR